MCLSKRGQISPSSSQPNIRVLQPSIYQGAQVSAIPSGDGDVHSFTPIIIVTISESAGDSELYSNLPTDACMHYGGENSTCIGARKLLNWFNEERPSREQLDEHRQANPIAHHPTPLMVAALR